ncbi:MAG: M48 family metallopeptidase [Patescibacteria group bacterium]
MLNIYEAQALNRRKSFVVVLLFFIFVGISLYFLLNAFGYYYGFESGSIAIFFPAFAFSGLFSFLGYYFSDRLVLAISGAKKADKKNFFDFYSVTENLSIGAGIPMPELYVIDDSAPNAFATGRDPDHAVICATSGLLQKLNRSELEGVISHEMSHIKNFDTRLQTIVAIMAGLIALLGDWLLRGRLGIRKSSNNNDDNSLGGIFMLLGIIFAILSPVIAKLIQLAISRKREFLADSGSVAITHQPSGLISALKKISNDLEPLEVANKATAHLYIVSPFKGKIHGGVDWFSSLFNTHPPINERLKALNKMS